jgi:hypothetical protein
MAILRQKYAGRQVCSLQALRNGPLGDKGTPSQIRDTEASKLM